MSYPSFEQAILSLQWHKGVMGFGRGFDERMMNDIQELSSKGFELKAALSQPDPTWFTLFFQRQRVPGAGGPTVRAAASTPVPRVAPTTPFYSSRNAGVWPADK